MVRIPGTTFSDSSFSGDVTSIKIEKAAEIFSEYMWRSAGLEPDETQTDDHLTQQEMKEHLIGLLAKS